MSVHVDELHTDLAASGSLQAPADEPEAPWVPEIRWQEARCRSDWLARRVSAVDFDD
ncbi:hypothetical protein EV644_12431 [Kribbella orskensis]|uniref:Uncharacterized protein n=1 Tax=Kribbella orskensis TaxID=2512216 RepID=A0ABY2BA32_9ACTN|nr:MULTISPECIES: hypothetical protein [Kribbella]TCN32775.1 hypothetical protein EV642_12667 [Kribbella sp. VKM Ac-2500]TCO12907.1 hypothetical protein EV644_12431 [Kribbella orskensis]